jgi:hypothetical protein
MAKHTVYQIQKSNRDLASQALFYGTSTAFTKATAIKAFAEQKYRRTADVEAENNNQVKALVNTDRSNPKVLPVAGLRNVNVGDIIYNHETKIYYIVKSEGYDRIKIKLR